MLHHTEIINKLIEKNGYKYYLEIGVQNPENNFDKVAIDNMVGYKQGVDPEYKGDYINIAKITSDDFFKKTERVFDIIFIDGLHEYEQVKRDIENSLEILNAGGTIVVHDCLPTNEDMQKVPRITREWTGDVWRAIVDMRGRDDLRVFTIDTDYGVGIITKGKQLPITEKGDMMTYATFDKFRTKYMNIISAEQFLKYVSE